MTDGVHQNGATVKNVKRYQPDKNASAGQAKIEILSKLLDFYNTRTYFMQNSMELDMKKVSDLKALT